MSDRETRQFVLSDLFLKHQNIYIPWPGTDIYYAEFLEKNIAEILNLISPEKFLENA